MRSAGRVLSMLALSVSAWIAGCSDPAPSASPPAAQGSSQTPEDASAGNAAAPEIPVDRPTFADPVTAGMACVPSSGSTEAGSADVVDVWVKVQVAAGYYVYGQLEESAPFHALKVELQLPAGAQPLGEWEFPPPGQKNGHEIYGGTLMLHRRISVADRSEHPLQATVHYQACSDEACLLPDKIVLNETVPWSP